MKKYINRNYFWASLFVAQLSKLGVKDVCISPGSRNTPLTLAFANNKSFKKYVQIDERSNGFFALGIAKEQKNPVVIVTTSGTAVAELYPAIIEAYIQRIPLIICSADRPSYLRNTGANQTINQENIFSNHIRKFTDFGLPSINKKKLNGFVDKIIKGIDVCSSQDQGPVHFNFPFVKPLEPNSFTEEIPLKIVDLVKNLPIIKKKVRNPKSFNKVVKQLERAKRPAILLGWGDFDQKFYRKLTSFSIKNTIPILVDGSSDYRFFKGSNQNIIVNQSGFINELKELPDLILHFGNAPTSQSMLKFINESKAKRFLVNEFGDVKDPSKEKGELLSIFPIEFLEEVSKILGLGKSRTWLDDLIKMDNECEELKINLIPKSKMELEPSIANKILDLIPPKSNLFISNSLPIRDFDLFASKRKKDLRIFTNRGASGIDGIISTASGIAVESKVNNFLIIGDLAFYHNMSTLATLDELKIPLTIILVNNNGGGIFKMLPVSDNSENFDKYFNTPHNVDFKKVIKAFQGNYYSPKSWKTFEDNFRKSVENKSYSVIELKTDSDKSVDFRKEYLAQIKSLFTKI